METPLGCREYVGPLGSRVLDIAFIADEEKRDPEWEQTQPGYGTPEWAREMRKDLSVYEGIAVYPNYVDELHCVETRSGNKVRAFPVLTDSLWWGGWDIGASTVHPAFVLVQMTADWQLMPMLEFYDELRYSNLQTFCPALKALLRQKYPHLTRIHHFGDPSGNARGGNDGYTAFETAARHGFHVLPAMTNNPSRRIDAVSWALEEPHVSKLPTLIFSKTHTPMLVEAMRGAYCYPPPGKTHAVHNVGATARTPLKNAYSHISEALQYVMLHMQAFILGQMVAPGQGRAYRKRPRI